MTRGNRKFVFKALTVVTGALATIITLLFPVLEAGKWIQREAAWALWVIVALLVVSVVLLSARVSALKEQILAEEHARGEAQGMAQRAVQDATRAYERAAAAESEAVGRSTGLSEQDRDLAARLYRFASDEYILRELATLFAYAIPVDLVQSMEELADIPLTRAAHDPALAQEVEHLTQAARQWILKLVPLVSVRGDKYTTRLDRWVSDDLYQQREADVEQLMEAGDDLHTRLLAYQQYYSSLSSPTA